MLRHAERYPWLRSESLTDAEAVVVVVIDGRNLEDGVQHFGKGRFAPIDSIRAGTSWKTLLRKQSLCQGQAVEFPDIHEAEVGLLVAHERATAADVEVEGDDGELLGVTLHEREESRGNQMDAGEGEGQAQLTALLTRLCVLPAHQTMARAASTSPACS